MRNPPVVREIIAGKFSPEPSSAQGPSYFLIRYQANGLYVKYSSEKDNLSDATGLSNLEMAAGNYSGSRWAFLGAHYSGRNTLYIEGPAAPGDIIRTIDNIEQPAHLILNMGIGYFKAGSIPWTNDAYKVHQSGAYYRTGRAIRDGNGRVAEIELTGRAMERNSWSTNRILLHYSYETNSPTAGLPTLITAVRYTADGRILELDRLRIYSAALGGMPLEPDDFQPKKLSPVTMTILGSNQVQIASSASMAPRQVLAVDDPAVQRFDRRTSRKHLVYFASGAIILAVAPLLLVRIYLRSVKRRQH
jgi:hypothetical protein